MASFPVLSVRLVRNLSRAGGALAVALCAAVAVPSRAAEMGGPASCRFEVPAGWNAQAARWEGECVGGLASGLGVMRHYAAGATTPSQVLYALIERGRLVRGVIETPDGYRAGPFQAGMLVDTDQRSAIIAAFDTASRAARAASQRFERAGNKASARLYADRARRLSEQMD